MKKRAAVTGRKQEGTQVAMSVAMQQLMLPLLPAMDATKKGLLAFVQQMGMVALSELLAKEAAMIAGPKGQHIEGRTHHHWGTATTPVGFGGRNVSLPYPRVRARGKGRGEVTLPSIEALRDGDPMAIFHGREAAAVWTAQKLVTRLVDAVPACAIRAGGERRVRLPGAIGVARTCLERGARHRQPCASRPTVARRRLVTAHRVSRARPRGHAGRKLGVANDVLAGLRVKSRATHADEMTMAGRRPFMQRMRGRHDEGREGGGGNMRLGSRPYNDGVGLRVLVLMDTRGREAPATRARRRWARGARRTAGGRPRRSRGFLR